MEGGVAAAELLLGLGNPSGKLSDTFARRLEDYPSTEGFHESGNTGGQFISRLIRLASDTGGNPVNFFNVL